MNEILNIDGSGRFILKGVLTGRAWEIDIIKKIDGEEADFEGEHQVNIYEDRKHLIKKTTLAVIQNGSSIRFGQNDAENIFVEGTYYAELEQIISANKTMRILKFDINVERSK